MKINFNVKRKFKFNGKEYNSVEEMPDDVREVFKKAMTSKSDIGHKQAVQTKITFNGTTYESIDSMPQDVRLMYEKIMKAAEIGAAPDEFSISAGGDLELKIKGERTNQNPVTKPTRFESSFSPRKLIISLILAALLFLIYYLFHGSGLK